MRYPCLAEPAYWASLSPASRHSLVLQGGIHTAEQAGAFLQQPYARDAVRLRRWDDLAKVPGAATPDLGDIARLLADAADRHRAARLARRLGIVTVSIDDVLTAARKATRGSGPTWRSRTRYRLPSRVPADMMRSATVICRFMCTPMCDVPPRP